MTYQTHVHTSWDFRSRGCTTRPLFLALCLALLFVLLPAESKGFFHLWSVSEVYSSADGSVQFIELTAESGGQQFMSFGGSITSMNANDSQTVGLSTDLPGDSAGKVCIIGTSNLATIPGGLVPDYFIPAGFILPPVDGQDASVTYNPDGDRLTYSSLPADGDLALAKPAGSVEPAQNSLRNFHGDTNLIVPVKLLSSRKLGTNFVTTFRTATGTNHSTGPTYHVEFKTNLTDTAWGTLTNITGDGTTKSISNSVAGVSRRIFRLRVQ